MNCTEQAYHCHVRWILQSKIGRIMCSYFTAGGGVAKLKIAEAPAGEGEGEGSDMVNAKTRFWRSQSEVRRNGIMDSNVDRLICNA